MNLITAAEVCAYLKIPVTAIIEPHIDTAHALVAQAILTRDLDERAVVETHTLKYASELIELRDGPIQEVVSVIVNGVDADLDDYIIGYWTIQNPEGWSKGDVIEVDYVACWSGSSSESNLPAAIRQALILAAAQVFNTPSQDLVYEKIGDYTKQTAQGVPGKDTTAALEPRSLLLLRPYRRPQIS